jgi:hypothetical protein
MNSTCGLSYRDVEELLAERGVEVDHVTVYRWVQRFSPLLAEAARFCRHSPGDRWFVDETYVKVNGVRRYVYRAVDQYGQVIDVLVSVRRDAAAARRFFRRALATLTLVSKTRSGVQSSRLRVPCRPAAIGTCPRPTDRRGHRPAVQATRTAEMLGQQFHLPGRREPGR